MFYEPGFVSTNELVSFFFSFAICIDGLLESLHCSWFSGNI